MKVRLNEDRQVVDAIREGLKRTGGYCPCRLARTEENRERFPLHCQDCDENCFV